MLRTRAANSGRDPNENNFRAVARERRLSAIIAVAAADVDRFRVVFFEKDILPFHRAHNAFPSLAPGVDRHISIVAFPTFEMVEQTAILGGLGVVRNVS